MTFTSFYMLSGCCDAMGARFINALYSCIVSHQLSTFGQLQVRRRGGEGGVACLETPTKIKNN